MEMCEKYTGEKLKQLRKQAGLSQAKAAKLVHLSSRSWEKWEQSPDTVSHQAPPYWIFPFLEMYILLKNKGIEYEPME